LVGTHDWNKYITPEELKRMIEKDLAAGKCYDMKGIVVDMKSASKMLLDGFCQSNHNFRWKLSDDDLAINYIAHFVKL
jgi:2-polyprenyl-3-methyl-5-hydroxy-6-metoxy-1,4-benzoquinol methylase